VLAGVVLSARVATGGNILERRWGLLVELGLWGLAWAAGVVAALRLAPRSGSTLIVLAGCAIRVATLVGPPVTSDDFYRYAWDGRVQAAGVDPYRHAPTSPELAGLREPWLWPDGESPDRTLINRPTQPTIYPPVAQAWFAAVYRVAGIDARHKAWQVAGLLPEVGVLLLLPVALRRFGRDPRWTALYALSPAPVLEMVNNGHVDGVAILLVVAALAVAGSAWRHHHPGLGDLAAGALLGGAAMVKLFPVILVVAFVGRRRVHSAARLAVAAAVVGAIAYLPHVLDVGWKVLGYLPGYLREERYVGGGRFLVASVLGLSGVAAAVVSAVAFGAVVAWVVVRRPPIAGGAAAVMGAALLATSPVQPWYAVTLLALATVAVQPRWAAVLVAGYPYFWAIILGYENAATIGAASYALALVVVVVLGRLAPTRPANAGQPESGSGPRSAASMTARISSP